MKEYLLSTNKYLEPASVEGSEAYAILIIRLLLLEPGANPLHSDMGVGLGPKYRYILEDQISVLQDRIRDQLQTYLPLEFDATTKVYMEIKPSKYLMITIVSNDTKYTFDTESSNIPIQLATVLK